MSRRIFTLPLRMVAPIKPQWICKRCLATQAQPTTDLSRNYAQVRPSELLSEPLPQRQIPDHYLQHVNAEKLPIVEQEQWERVTPHKKIVGVVVSHGKMDRTVKVKVAGMMFNTRIKKYYRRDNNHLVHDPNNSLVTGDVVELHRLKVSARVEHVVASIISPFGTPTASRPPIPSPEERLAAYKQRRFLKLQRRELRIRAADGDAEAVEQLKEMSVDIEAGEKE